MSLMACPVVRKTWKR